MSEDLTAAERAVARLLLYEEGSEWAVDTERHIELARAVVPVVRPIIEAEALDDAAEALAEVAAQKGREPYLTSQRLRFGLTSAAQRLRDRAEAARRSGEGRTDG